MVKLSMVTRTERELGRDTKHELHRVHASLDPRLHPLQPVREFQRAVVAAKTQQIFAKPFVAALDDHVAGVTTLSKALAVPELLVSGAVDGEVICWDLAQRKSAFRLQCFENAVRSVSLAAAGDLFAAAGDDYHISLYGRLDVEEAFAHRLPIPTRQKLVSRSMVNSVELCPGRASLVAAGERVELWDLAKAAVVERFAWGADAVSRARFSPCEPELLLCAAMDRGLFLFDTRQRSLLAKVTLLNKSGCVAWNPMEPFNFVAGNEDGCAYGFDMRRLGRPRTIYKDHLGAVLDVDFAPTGRAFATASFDKTVRLFDVAHGRSRDLFHAKRMQKVFAVQWTVDDKYVVSGSEDANLRVWKSSKHAVDGNVSQREQRAADYREKLVRKFARTKAVRDIKRTHLPKYILNDQRKKQIMKEARFRRTENRRIYNEEVFEEERPEKDRKVVKFEQ